MTDRELKLELAKAAIANGNNIEYAKQFFEWITEEPERNIDNHAIATEYDDVPIEEFARKTNKVGMITNACKDNGINTVGDLIRCGAKRFRTFKNVGNSKVIAVNEALEYCYNIKDWYTT